MKQLIFLFAILCATSAAANTASIFGLGPVSISMGGTTVLHGEANAFQTFSQPAALGFLHHVEAALGFQSMDPKLKPFGTLVLNSNGTQGDFASAGVLGGSGQNLAFAFPIGKKEHPFTVGAAFYLPSDSMVRVSGAPVNYPFYPLYNDIARNAFFVIGAGYELGAGIAAGVHMRSSIKSTAQYQLRADNNINYSASAVEARSTTRFSFALLWDLEKKFQKPWTVGLSYRAKSYLETKLAADITAFVPIQGELVSIPAFSPAEWILSTATRIGGSTFVSFDLARIQWNEYTYPYGTGNINSFIIGQGQSRSAGFKNIWVPRVGMEKRWSRWRLRAGYFYYPSPVPDQTGDTNFVDNKRHVFSAGLGYHMPKPWSDDPQQYLKLDAFFQWNELVERRIQKTRATNIGAPGYTTGGHIVVYGAAASLSF
jgi:long-subunit fatty acid transport protein